MEYRCVAASVTGFLQQVASCYLPHGYWFYVRGRVPDSKDPRQLDQKLIEKYCIGLSRSSRTRRKAVGIANVHYIRFQRDFLLLATHGQHPFFDDEGPNIRDARRVPIPFRGYAISVKQGGFLRKESPAVQPTRDDRWHAHVRIDQDRYQLLKTSALDAAKRMSAERLEAEFYRMPFEPYAPVRQQLFNLLRLVNQQRKASGLEPLPSKAIRYQRRIVKPFEPVHNDVPIGKPAENPPAPETDAETGKIGLSDSRPDSQPGSGWKFPHRPKFDDDFLKRFWPQVEKKQPSE
jgi:hypothetical protein